MALEGNLHDMTLTDLFQIFRSGPKSGVLILSSGPERGIVYVFQGRLIDAVLVRGTERHIVTTAEEAVIQLLQWEDASFIFRHDTSVAARMPRIIHDSEWLILEAMKRRENPLRLPPHQQLAPESRLELAAMPTSAESGVNLDLDQWRVLSQIAISDNLRQICERTDLPLIDGIRIATELLVIGLIEVAQPPRPQPVAKPSGLGRSLSELVRVQPLKPAYANMGMSEQAPSPPTERGLLGAIMRRIRGL